MTSVFDPQEEFEQEQPKAYYDMDPIDRFKEQAPLVFGPMISKELIAGLPDFSKFEYLDLMKEYGRNKRSSLFLFGSVGTGKTFSACLAAIYGKRKLRNYCILSSIELVIVSELMTKLKSLVEFNRPKYADDTGENPYNGLINHLKNVPHLILDDFGAEKKSEYVRDILFEIINYRYNQNMRIIVTSNYSTKKLIGMGYTREVSRIMKMVTRNNGRFVKFTKNLRNTQDIKSFVVKAGD